MRGFQGIVLCALFVGAWTLQVAAAPPLPPLPPRSTDIAPARLPPEAERAAPPPRGTRLWFEPNRGQADARARFVARNQDVAVFLTDAGAVLALQAAQRRQAAVDLAPRAGPAQPPWLPDWLASPDPANAPGADAGATPVLTDALALRYRFAGARAHPRIDGVDPLPGRSNYFIGSDPQRWHRDVPQFAAVRYRDVLPGVNVLFYGKDGQLEFDVEVAAGIDLGAVRLRVDGAEGLDQDADGNLLVHTARGDLVQRRPVVYQMIAGERREVRAGYVLLDRDSGGRAHAVAFAASDYDHRVALVLDPTLVFAQLLGGSGDDKGASVATDADGNIYLAGYTSSANFPTTVGAYQTATPTGYDAFVRKLSADGSTVVYSTLLGGNNGSDYLQSIAVDGNGIAYVSGLTSATNFPVKNALQGTNPGGMFNLSVGFVSALNAAGSDLVYSTYFGGDGPTNGLAIAVDAAGYAYVSGYTFASNLPVSAGAFQANLAGGDDAFVAKFTPAGARAYATYLGGTGYDSGNAIAIDDLGAAYVVGFASSATLGGVTPAAIGPLGGAQEILLAVVNPAGDGLTYATRIGGDGDDEGNAVAVDGGHQVYLSALSNSTDLAPAPPMTGSAYGAWIGHIDDSGTQLLESAWYGASDGGNAFSAGVDLDEGRQSLVVVGRSDKPGSLPVLNPVTALDCAAACSAATGAFLLRYALQPLTLTSATRSTGGSATNTLLSAAAHDAATGRVVAIGASDGAPPTPAAAFKPAGAMSGPAATTVATDDAWVLDADLADFQGILPPDVDKYFNPAELEDARTGTLTFVVTNRNPQAALTGVQFYDFLPACVIGLGGAKFSPPDCADLFFAIAGTTLFGLSARDLQSPLLPGKRCAVTVTIEANGAGVCNNKTTAIASQESESPGRAASATLSVTDVAGKVWSGTSSSMSAGGNWVGGVAPAAGQSVTFPSGATQTVVNNDLPALQPINQVILAGGSYQLGGGTYALQAGIANSGSGNTVSAPIKQVLAGVFRNTGGSLTLSGGIDLNGNDSYFEVDGSTNVSAPVGGNGNVFIGGHGSVTVSATPTFSGDFHVVEGTLIAAGLLPEKTFLDGPGTLRGIGPFGAIEQRGGFFRPGTGTTPANVDVGDLTLVSKLILDYGPGNATHSSVNGTGSVLLSGMTVQLNFATEPAVDATFPGLITSPGGSISGCPSLVVAAQPNLVLTPLCTPTAVGAKVYSNERVFLGNFQF